jgi:hypothetical protein
MDSYEFIQFFFLFSFLFSGCDMTTVITTLDLTQKQREQQDTVRLGRGSLDH